MKFSVFIFIFINVKDDQFEKFRFRMRRRRNEYHLRKLEKKIPIANIRERKEKGV